MHFYNDRNAFWWTALWVAFAVLVMLCFVGCSSPTGVSIDPRTWFSGSELRDVERAEAEVVIHRDEAVSKARNEVAKAAQSIAAAPQENLPVQLTGRFVNNALPLLDQVAGPMTAAEAAELRQLVTDLLAGKTEAEAKQQRLETQLETLSRDLDAALVSLDRKQAELKKAHAENLRTLNAYRTAQFYGWAGAGASLLLMAGMWYLKTFYGGGIKGMAAALTDLRNRNHPALPDFVNALDVNLSPALQRLVAKQRPASHEL